MNLIETSLLIQVISDNAGLAFLTILVTLYLVCRVILLVWTRLMRHLSIRAQGWPPPHLDADGDFRPVDSFSHDDE